MESLHHPERWKDAPAFLRMDDHRLQALLMETAFPDAQDPAQEWLELDEEGSSLAERFAMYRDSEEHKYDQIDRTDRYAVEALLEAVKHTPTKEELRARLPLTNDRVKHLLMQEHFPYDHDRIDRWKQEGLEDRLAAYCAAHLQETLNVNDEEEVRALLERVKEASPGTLH